MQYSPLFVFKDFGGILDGSRQHEDIGGQYKLKTGKIFEDLNLNLTTMME